MDKVEFCKGVGKEYIESEARQAAWQDSWLLRLSRIPKVATILSPRILHEPPAFFMHGVIDEKYLLKNSRRPWVPSAEAGFRPRISAVRTAAGLVTSRGQTQATLGTLSPWP